MFDLSRRKCVGLLAAGLIFLAPQSAHAILLDFIPSSQNVNLGDSFEVGLRISGLGSSSAPSLGAFDLDVLFDETLLSYNSVAFGDPVLGDQLDLFGLGSIASAASGTGKVNVFELSLDSVTDLDSQQSSEFILARLRFDTLAVGSGSINLNVNSLGDANGEPLDFSTGQASFSTGVVPEPATMFSLFGGLAFLKGRKWGIRRTQAECDQKITT